ncbi:sugar isomerase domain-containing protein [Georgenia sp. SYP-B2076]|uniref:sugar isomerase domain-containing protein n=1 Tax=Georgenia sp. SYP-B2076 TaxID=2495881 RepID=UPI0013DFDAF0|nr:sugar isomerase domain-containing protein [Georgenia sp. SYP-B2076]
MTNSAARPLRATAQLVVTTWKDDRLVYSAGAGHSIAGVIETFFRAGGLAHVRPLWHPDLLPLHGAARSTAAERTEGLGPSVVGASPIRRGDALVIFSSSGINFYPVEVARHARERGAAVVAVTSVRASRAAPARAGVRLEEIADVVIDTEVPPGDASWPPGAPETAPLSSVSNTVLWDAVLVLARQLEPGLGLWRSANTAGGDAGNAALLRRFSALVPEIMGSAQRPG